MRAIALACVGLAMSPAACDESIRYPPCLPDCVPQPCEREYPLFWTPELSGLVAHFEGVVDEECEPPPPGELTATLSCRAGGEDYVAIVEYDEAGRLIAVQFPFNKGVCVTEYAFGYDGAHLVHVSRRESVCEDGVPYYEAWSDVRWKRDRPAEELVVTRERAHAGIDPVILDGEFERYETARQWDAEGRPLWEETLVGAERVFFGRRDLTWSNGVLVRAVTQRNWPGYPGDQPGCDQLGPNWSSCEATFEYEDGVMVSYSESNRTIAISDDCCPYIGCREPGWLPSLP